MSTQKTMLCQKCGLDEATVHRDEYVYRRKVEEHLCATCANKSMPFEHSVGLPRKLSHEFEQSIDETTGLLADTEKHVLRVLCPAERFACLTISIGDFHDVIGLFSVNSLAQVDFETTTIPPPFSAGTIRSILAIRGFQPTEGVFGKTNDVPGGAPVLSYILPSEVAVISRIIEIVLKAVYSAGEGSSLKFNHEEDKTA